MEIGDKPRIVLERGRIKWRFVAKAAYRKVSREYGCRVDHMHRVNAAHVIAIERDHIDAVLGRYHRNHSLTGTNLIFYALIKVVHELAIPLGNGDKGLRLGSALPDA